MFRGFVVEDNPSARAALVESLAELAGVTTVGYAGDERTAVTWLKDPANDWDLALIDLDLGTGGSGYKVVEALGRRQPHQRVVVWTATAGALARARCRTLGADRVFDRATENSQLMDYCLAQSEAHARAAAALARFPAAAPSPATQQSQQSPLAGASF